MRTRSKPSWLGRKIDFRKLHETEAPLAGLNLHTVCSQAKCPNISECYSKKTATFMILGDTCTRGCLFCAVSKGVPEFWAPDEHERVSEAASRLGLKYAVITSVTRDDLPDGGAGAFVKVIRALKDKISGIRVEVLVPDFQGDFSCVDAVCAAAPDVFGHNVETVPEMYAVRTGASFERSLSVLKRAKDNGMTTKSALLLGFGETKEQVIKAMKRLRGADCDYLSIGQYLQPDASRIEVKEYVVPEVFEELKQDGIKMGFKHVESAPYVRSSYRAERYER